MKNLQDDDEFIKAKPAHQQFLMNLISGKSTTESYALAFPKAKRTTAGAKGHKLKTQYAQLLERVQPLNPDTIENISNQTLHNLTLMAFADLGDIVDENGEPKHIHKIPRSVRMAITEIEIEGNKVKYKVGGKLKALEILSRVARLNPVDNEINISLINEEERDSKIKEIIVRAQGRKADGEDEGEL